MTASIKQKNFNLIDSLRRYQNEFNDDFSFRDIIPEIQDCISRNEMLEINILPDEEQKIERLFFTFIYIKKDVGALIKCLESSYRWLYDKIILNKEDKWISDYRKAIQDVPNNQDWNIHRTSYLWEIQKNLRSLKRNQYLILFGKLGFGKRWLAADACRDFGIICKMNFKIYWLNVSKCSTQELVLEKMHRLKVLLQADDLDIKYNTYSGNTKNEIIHMRNYLRKILEQPEFRECLIVLSDVQDENIVKAFDLHCKMFITTRHIEKLEDIPNTSRTKIDIDKGFTEEESLELFTKAFNDILPVDMPDYVAKFNKICSGHPFIISMIAKTFQNFKESVEGRKTRSENWLKNLGEYKIQDKNDQIKMSVEASLKFLTINQQICYKKMVIFTDNSDIPFKVLEKIWDTDAELTEEIVLKLSKYSLIEKPINDDNDKACSLHYLHFHFLKQHVPKDDQVKFHRHLIEKYEVEKVLRERKELDLDFPNDNYFHYFIPYHFVGAKMQHLFDIYIDFGFLEQKMRYTQLPNTAGDLIRFEHEITARDKTRSDLLPELISFLTNYEQLIFKSSDVNLLQCALTSFGLVQLEAQKQIMNFNDRVWMNDLNHEENQTQIVQLLGKSQPFLVRFVKPSDALVCLISLHDNNILLQDISQNYGLDAVLYQNEINNSSQIIDMQAFRNHSFLALDEQGKLSVFTLKNSTGRRISGPPRTNALNSSKVLQRLENGSDKITCFNVFENQTEQIQPLIDLIVGTSQGLIKFYQWKVNRFEENKIMMLKTGFANLFRMARIQHEYMMLLNSRGELKFVSLTNSGDLATSTKWSPIEAPVNLHHGICSQSLRPVTVCVAKNRVVQVTHEIKRSYPNSIMILVEYDDVFEANENFDTNNILSSTMSKDAEYLILGTTKGIIVINRCHRKVIIRRNLSDQVTSLDIFRYPDEALYILSSVFKDAGHILNLYAFNSNRDEQAVINNEMIFFVGEDLFDVNKSSDEWQMVAVDTNRKIHWRSCEDDFSRSVQSFKFKFEVKKICYCGEKVVVGCTNGDVFSIDRFEQKILLTTLESEITYLECIDGTIIASCNSSFRIVGIVEELDGKLNKAFRYKEKCQLLLVKDNYAIDIIDTRTGKISMSQKILTEGGSCTAQAFSDDLVVIGTSENTALIRKVDEDANIMDIRKINVDSAITSLAISADKNVLAIGCSNGKIEIHDLINKTLLQKLESHKRPIMAMHFSPWKNVNDPLILLSLSESVVFWNIRSIQNNPMDFKKNDAQSRVRVSHRFKTPLKPFTPTPTDSKLLTATENLTLNDSNPWRKKTGASDKRELLSCIKLVAKSAKQIIFNEDFTRFVTIDNEGNVYHLRMIDKTSDNQLTIDFNGNPSQRNE